MASAACCDRDAKPKRRRSSRDYTGDAGNPGMGNRALSRLPSMTPTPMAGITPTTTRGGTRPKQLQVMDVPSEEWTTELSAELYGINGWGQPFFNINAEGNVEVDPAGWTDAQTPSIDMFHLVEDCIKRGHEPPLIIRFSDMLHDRVKLLNEAFRRSLQEYKYDNEFRHVYPLKVCQNRSVVEEIVLYGDEYHVGLSAGSKPELLIVLASLKRRETLIICTGYKDTEYVETALLAQQLGQIPVIIIEKLVEIDLVLEASAKLGIKPIIGVRGKIQSVQVSSKERIGFSMDVGEKAKFGLSPTDIMTVVQRLMDVNLLDSLQMFHFHIGSQICKISAVKAALREAAQYYVQLCKLGANMKYFDVGGGLAVDYDGSKTSTPMSLNYSVDEYAADVVVAIKDSCTKHGLPVPVIISESGRSVTAHHSVAVFNVTDATTVHPLAPPSNGGLYSTSADIPEPSKDDHELCIKLYEVLRNIEVSNLQESIHDARQYKDEALALFTLGMLPLSDRAKVETLYWCCINDVVECLRDLRYIPEELEELRSMLSHTYYCNFSLFQSCPDSWARQFVFPVMPIHRLNEKPTVLATLADLTCDSDGKVAHFISSNRDGSDKDMLELHKLEKDKPYYIGMFMVGAYQEVLSSMHNLYGDTNIMMVEVDSDNARGYSIEHVIRGNTIDDVLRSFQYDPSHMLEMIRVQSERALKNKELTLAQYKTLVTHYERSLRNYTYLSTETKTPQTDNYNSYGMGMGMGHGVGMNMNMNMHMNMNMMGMGMGMDGVGVGVGQGGADKALHPIPSITKYIFGNGPSSHAPGVSSVATSNKPASAAAAGVAAGAGVAHAHSSSTSTSTSSASSSSSSSSSSHPPSSSSSSPSSSSSSSLSSPTNAPGQTDHHETHAHETVTEGAKKDVTPQE